MHGARGPGSATNGVDTLSHGHDHLACRMALREAADLVRSLGQREGPVHHRGHLPVFDPSFKGDGTVITNVTPHADLAYGMAIDPDGRIVAAGTAGDGGPAPRFGTVRYLADGTLDSTFGGDGTVTTNLTSGFDSAWNVAIQSDGSVVCSGVAGAGGSHASFAVLRYKP